MATCTACGGPLVSLGALGNKHWYRCRDCGIDQHTDKRSTRHYHVLSGFNGLYMPDGNAVFQTKQEAHDYLRFLGQEVRDRIARDRQEAQPGDHVDRLTGSLREGCYIVERSETQIDYVYQIVECYEMDCLEDVDA